MRLTRSSALSAACVAVATAAGTLVAAPAATAAEPTAPFISEIHYDNAGTDIGEFVEVQVPGRHQRRRLDRRALQRQRTARSTTPTRCRPSPRRRRAVRRRVVDYPANGIQNGSPDGLALVERHGTVAEFLSYEGTFTADGRPGERARRAPTSASSEVGTGAGRPACPAATTRPPATTCGRRRGGEHARARSTRRWTAEPRRSSRATPRRPTRSAPSRAPASAPRSPASRSTCAASSSATCPASAASTCRTPTATATPPPPTASSWPARSRSASATRSPSSGSAAEDFGADPDHPREDVEVCADGSAADLPAAAPLDLPADDAAREPLEGMLVAPGRHAHRQRGLRPHPVRRAHAVRGRPARAADRARPARLAGGRRRSRRTTPLRRIVLDDGSNASRERDQPALPQSPTTPVRVGDELDFTAPLVLGYGFGNWRLQPADGTPEGTFAPQNTRPAAPDAVGGDVQVGAFNVLNYFLTLTGPDARGATSPAAVRASRPPRSCRRSRRSTPTS